MGLFTVVIPVPGSGGRRNNPPVPPYAPGGSATDEDDYDIGDAISDVIEAIGNAVKGRRDRDAEGNPIPPDQQSGVRPPRGAPSEGPVDPGDPSGPNFPKQAGGAAAAGAVAGFAAASFYDDIKDFLDPSVPDQPNDPPDWADPEATSGDNNNGKNQ